MNKLNFKTSWELIIYLKTEKGKIKKKKHKKGELKES